MTSPSFKTLTILANEWFDKANGNSYFSASVYLDNVEKLRIPFSYGYGDHYKEVAAIALNRLGLLPGFDERRDSLWTYCGRVGVSLLTKKQEGCKRRDLLTKEQAESFNSSVTL